jgi:AcrR family transcriptional regulator
MGMSIPYEASGRTQQKQRTRRTLIDAARALIAAGATPTVEEAAAAAEISRTTAYRYFPTQRDLLVAAYPVIEQPSLLKADAPDDVEARLDLVVSAYLRITIANEPAIRTALRLALDQEGTRGEQLLLRQGRVIAWLEDALAPLRGRVPAQDLTRLVRAIRSAVGIEALVWLCDVAGLSRDEAQELMHWSARALLRAALAEAGVDPKELAPDQPRPD